MTASTNTFLRSLRGTLERHFRTYAVLVVVVIVVAGFFGVLQPKIAELKSVGLFQLRQSKERLAQKRELLDLTERLVERYRVIGEAESAKLELLLPQQPDIASMFVSIEAVAKSVGMRVTNISFSDSGARQTKTAPSSSANGNTNTAAASKTNANTNAATENERSNGAKKAVSPAMPAGVERLAVSFSVSGGRGYASFKQLLAAIETNIRLLDVETVSYTPGQAGEAETYLINALTYYRP